MSDGGIPVSVIVMTLNEQANIAACLDTVTHFDQVFVVDSGSNDDTALIAAQRGATVVPFTWNGRYPKKKQWCLDQLPFRHDWVFFVDTDERLTPALVAEIADLFRSGPERHGYFIEGRYVFLGRVLRFGLRNRKLAFFDRRVASFPPCDDLSVSRMWEVEGHYQPKIEGTIGRLAAPMLHADDKPLFAWFERHNRYSDWEAELEESGALDRLAEAENPKRRFLKRLFRGLPLRPFAAFLHSYVVKLGFLDGAAGLHFALARSFYYWQIGLKRRALRQRTSAAVISGSEAARITQAPPLSSRSSPAESR